VAEKMQASQKRKLEDEDDTQEPSRFRWTQYAIDMLLHQFKKQRSEGGWLLAPSYQREPYLWPTKRMQDLILTVFDDLPIPPIYLLVEKRSTGLFDGLQRISSLLKFQQNELLVPVDTQSKGEGIPKRFIQPCYQDLPMTTFSQLSYKGVCFFNNYTIFVVELHTVRHKQEYFKRLNYSLQQTQGERLHSSNTLRAQQVSELVKEHLENKLIEPDNATKKREKAFERMCCFFFLESKEGGWDNFTNKEVIMDFILKTEQFTDLLVTQVMQQVKAIHSKVYDVHLLSLLVAAQVNKDVLLGYDLIVKDKKLLKTFNRLLPKGNGKCKPSLQKTQKWFLALAEIPDLKLRCKYLRRKTTTSTKKEYTWRIFGAIHEWFESRCTLKELPSPQLCLICGMSTMTIWSTQDGGLCGRSTDLIETCEKCVEWLSLLSSSEARAFLQGDII
jgi:hypothetical protein